jgi:phenylpropionate dioxygenase-like ring-hydroxylating dioxygenase large terminal subunit
MLTSKQSVFRRFWYATVKISDLADGPKPFRLLGEDIVLFLDSERKPAALLDRCVHRTAKLSKGWCENGRIVCGYHGWTYDQRGDLVRIPQYKAGQQLPEYAVKSFNCQSRYGYAWVCLEEPLADIPDIAQDGEPGYRRIDQFYEVWRTAPLRFMENSFDNAHFAFVHRGTFGQLDQPVPKLFRLEETEYGFEAETIVDINNPPVSHRITGSVEPTTTRRLRNAWFMPFCRRLDIEYPSGLRHIIFNCATPIDDEHTLLAQILYRNDSEENCSTEELVAWDQAIIEEDREILESTDPDTPIDIGRREEGHMPSDRPGLIMRRRLLALLKAHGEAEIRRAGPTIAVGGLGGEADFDRAPIA